MIPKTSPNPYEAFKFMLFCSLECADIYRTLPASVKADQESVIKYLASYVDENGELHENLFTPEELEYLYTENREGFKSYFNMKEDSYIGPLWGILGTEVSNIRTNAKSIDQAIADMMTEGQKKSKKLTRAPVKADRNETAMGRSALHRCLTDKEAIPCPLKKQHAANFLPDKSAKQRIHSSAMPLFCHRFIEAFCASLSRHSFLCWVSASQTGTFIEASLLKTPNGWVFKLCIHFNNSNFKYAPYHQRFFYFMRSADYLSGLDARFLYQQ